jgi:alpha-L-rhamnosidase
MSYITPKTTLLSRQGPYLYDDNYNGVTYDARLETPGWAAPGFDPSAATATTSNSTWTPVVLAKSQPGFALAASTLSSAAFQPITVSDRRQAEWVRSPSAGVYVFDFKQNAPVQAPNKQVASPPLPVSDAHPVRSLPPPLSPLSVQGWCRLRITGERGQRVQLRHAEVLQHPPYGPEDGNIYTANLRSAKATDVYILRGDPDGEVFEPTFTQHGFRYLA